MLSALRAKVIEMAFITLHVGLAPLPVIVIPVLPNQALKVWVVVGMVVDLPSGVNPSDVGG